MATERMIERLEAEGGYNEDFMNEFRIFRKELRGFFSASTFTDILEAIKPSLDEGALQVPPAALIPQFVPAPRHIPAQCRVYRGFKLRAWRH